MNTKQLFVNDVLAYLLTVCMMTDVGLCSLTTTTSTKTSAPSATTVEVCNTETFNPTCSNNEVIVIEKAQYGRLKLGRCVTSDFGYLHCVQDVMLELQSACSARRTCSIRVDDTAFTRVKPCHRDLKSYLIVTYRCTTVVSPSSRCSSAAAGEALVDVTSSSSSSSSSDSGADDAAGTSGLLSSQVTELTGCGTADWPWLIEARDGQRINITLHDFSREALASGHLGSGVWAGFAKQQSRTCKVYATIRDGSVGRSTTICGDQAPATHVFLSTTSRVEIRLLQPAAAKLTSKVKATSPDLQTSYFLLRYQVVGCANPTMQPGMKMTRNGDVITISCDVTSATASHDDSVWQMTCVRNHWVGSYGNCDAMPAALPSLFKGFGLRYSTSVTLIVIIAVCVIVSILTVGTLLIKWRLRPHQSRHYPTTTLAAGDVISDYDYRISGLAEKAHGTARYPLQSAVLAPSLDGQSDEQGNEYATMRLLGLQLTSQTGGVAGCQSTPWPAPPPRHCSVTSSDHPQRPVEHIYESPDSVRRAQPAARCDGRVACASDHPACSQLAAAGRYELPLPAVTGCHDPHRFTPALDDTAVSANYSL